MTWQSPEGIVERLVFGTRDEGVIDGAVGAFCGARLDAAVSDVLFRTTSVGVVFGVQLEDGRRVVVKAFAPGVLAPTLRAAQRVQSHLHAEGFPCPEPLVAPSRLARGIAVAEELVDDGEFRDTHEPAYRRLMAQTLAWHLDLSAACPKPAELGHGWSIYDSVRLWPARAHSPVLDLDANTEGTEWIDAIAARAKALASTPAPPLVGHHDWSGKHFRFAEDRVTVVYDWDSVQLACEAVIVGNAAMTFTANFDLPGLLLAPTPAEVRAFVDEYSDARPTPLTRREREQVAACATFIAAYTARCEHANPAGYDRENSFTSALCNHGDEYLRP